MEAQKRSKLMKQNILLALLVKAGSIGCSLVLVPMTINFVNATQYGIWLTISSVVVWMQFFDVGFSNGLRNKLTEALARDDVKQGQSYVSTTYAMLSAIFGTLMIIGIGLTWLLPVTPLFGLDLSYEPDLKNAMTVLLAYFCLNFVARTLAYVLMAKQRTAISSLLDLVGQLCVLLTIWLLKGKVEGSLAVLAYALCVPPLAVWVLASLGIYTTTYRNIAPRLSLVKMSDTRSLLSLGVKFFIIQIAFIIQFQSSNFLIARLFSMEQVTSYNIAYKYFNVLYMAFFLAIEPLWSAVTDAWARGEMDWIRRSVRRYFLLAIVISGAGVVLLALSGWVYDFWINSKVETPVDMPFSLSLWMLIYVATLMIAQVFCTFVNGIGALKIQFRTSLISPIVFVLATILLAKIWGLGMECVLIASILANFNGLILAPLQYHLVMHRGKGGIWRA